MPHALKKTTSSAAQPAAERVRRQPAPLLMSLLASKAPKGAINLALGEPLYETPSEIMEQWFDLLRNDQVGYGPDPGLPELRRELAAMHRVEVERVIVTCGASEALACALATVVQPGDEVIIPDPAFVAYDPLIRMMHGTPVIWPLLPEQDFMPDLNLLSRLVTERTRAIIVNNPHNPTGAVYPAPTLRALSNFADAQGILLISDEVYRHLTYDSPATSMASVSKNAVVISSFSKLFKLAGHRIGWAIAADPEAVLEAHLNLTFRAPTPSQQLALLAMKADRTGLLDYYARNRELLCSRLLDIDGLSFVKPAGTFFLWVDVSAYGNSWEVATRALAEGVVVAPNSGPGRGFGSSAPNHVRLSFAAEAGNLEEGVERFRRALQR
ncbi:MAG: pyridoxal phosphate-dependent aminotransferase [Alphaproteobacteria bacterium]